MRHAKLLDCTLRDGAYLVDKTFGEYNIKGIIDGLCKAHIDFIEIGFLQDEGFGEGKTVFLNTAEAKSYMPAEKKGCEFTLLADFSRYSINNLDYRSPDSIDCVRECFFKHERIEALDVCKNIKKKGYKLFIQPVDILGYTDLELIELLHMVNEVEPYCFSIVDTFGSMYQEDLNHVFELIHHNLFPTCIIGFHSHNNMQLSSALSQEFFRMTFGKREIVLDGTLSGMGRGAGNTPTELIAQYMISKQGYNYNLDSLLDIIDGYMNNIRARCTWGYSTPGFIAGCYSAHMNNISYLIEKPSIKSKDIRYILNQIGAEKRKRYDNDLLEKIYVDYLDSHIDDTASRNVLKQEISGKTVLVIAPGTTCITQLQKIKKCISDLNPIVITVNFVHEIIKSDYVFISNIKRFHYWINSIAFANTKKILTSNLADYCGDGDIIVSYTNLLKCGWEHMDNATIMLLRLLDLICPSDIYVAGFDGYSFYEGGKTNYYSQFLELESTKINPTELNVEIISMMKDYYETRINSNTKINFLTESRFAKIVNDTAF